MSEPVSYNDEPLDARYFRRLTRSMAFSEAYWRFTELSTLRMLCRGAELQGPVVDVGCGNGVNAAVLFKRIDCGIDACFAVLPRARAAAVYRSIVCADARRLSLQPVAFGTAFSNCALEHIRNVYAVFEEFSRILPEGGRIVFTVPTDVFNASLLFPYRWYVAMRNAQLGHVTVAPLSYWESLAQDYGFATVAHAYYMNRRQMKLWGIFEEFYHVPFLRQLWHIFLCVVMRPLVEFFLLQSDGAAVQKERCSAVAVIAEKRHGLSEGRSKRNNAKF